MKGVIKAVIAGSIIIGIGIAVLLITLAVNGWTFKPPVFDMHTFTAEEEIAALDINIGAGSVKTEYYDGDKITIDYPVSSATKTDINVNNGTLKFSTKTKRLISFGKWNIPETTIKVPEGLILDLKLDMDAGTVNIAYGNYNNLELDVDAGTVHVNGGTCKKVKLDIDAGSIKLNDVNCEKLDCELSAGSLKMENLTCPDAKIDVSAGSASIKFTGSQAEYTIIRKVSAGSCNVGAQTGSTDKKIVLDVSAGSVKIDFAD